MSENSFEQGVDHEALLYEKYKTLGYKHIHFCPNHDFMVIHEFSFEFQNCTCNFSPERL